MSYRNNDPIMRELDNICKNFVPERSSNAMLIKKSNRLHEIYTEVLNSDKDDSYIYLVCDKAARYINRAYYEAKRKNVMGVAPRVSYIYI